MIDDQRLFVAFAEAGSLARTARLLDVSRSTVMRRLDALEARLGIALVHRAGKRLALTEAGHRYAQGLTPVLEALDRVEQELHETSGRLVGRLRLALPFLGASRFLTPSLAAFHRTYPDVVLDVEFARDVRRLEVGTFDVAMQYGTRLNPDLRGQPLYGEQLILCASANYLNARGIPESAEDLDAHSVIMLRDLEGRVAPWRWPDGRRVQTPPPVAVTNSVVAAFELMLEGVGIARLPRLQAVGVLDSGRAAQVMPTLVNAAPVLFVYPPNPNPVTRAFLAFVKTHSVFGA
ncbi:MAG: LysR family transcriptional regulator [Bradymonadia bacterium]